MNNDIPESRRMDYAPQVPRQIKPHSGQQNKEPEVEWKKSLLRKASSVLRNVTLIISDPVDILKPFKKWGNTRFK